MSAIAFEGYDPGKAYMVGELPYRSRLGKLDFPLYAGRKPVGAMRSDVSSFIAGGVDSPCYRCTAWSREYLGSFEEVSDESGFVYREHIPFGSHPDIALIAPADAGAGDADFRHSSTPVLVFLQEIILHTLGDAVERAIEKPAARTLIPC